MSRTMLRQQWRNTIHMVGDGLRDSSINEASIHYREKICLKRKEAKVTQTGQNFGP